MKQILAQSQEGDVGTSIENVDTGIAAGIIFMLVVALWIGVGRKK